MLNNEIFLTTVIHNLQGFHIYYGMYVVARRLGNFFFLTLYDFLIQNGDYGGYLKEIFQPLLFLFLFFFGILQHFKITSFKERKRN
jgi:hypothetical protein